jgi:hypothetical protein
VTHRVAKSVARRIDHGHRCRECPDDSTPTDLDQWLDDGGRDVPDPDFDAAPGADSSAG